MGYKGTYFVQNVFSFGEKTIGNISEPECEISHSRLITPQNFTLGFRNFKE
jgi:hypothetical protein